MVNNHEARIKLGLNSRLSLLRRSAAPLCASYRAGQRLGLRAHRDDEVYTSYIEDVVYLCKRVNPAVPESEKIRHILKGIEDYAFQMLLGKNQHTVHEVLMWCLSYDELRKQRVFRSQPTVFKADVQRGSLSPLGYLMTFVLFSRT